MRDSVELTRLLRRAEFLLWVLARCDVEDLTEQRHYILRRLGEVEARTAQLGATDLYDLVLQSTTQGFLQWSYDEG